MLYWIILKPARYLPARYALFLPTQNLLITKMINLYFIKHRKVAGDDVNIKLNTNILQQGTEQRVPKFITINCSLIQGQ